jgi:hemerythrin
VGDSEQRGLRHRLRRIAGQIDDQHRHLRRFQEELRGAITPSSSAGAAPACARFRDALLAHFELEERLFFPALHGFDRSTEPTLVELQDRHISLRQEIERLHSLISEDAADVAAMLEQLLAHLNDHERDEETLWHLIE